MDVQEIICCLSNGNVVVVSDTLLLMYNKDDPKTEFTGSLTSFNRFHPTMFDEVVELIHRYQNTIPTKNQKIPAKRFNRSITLSLSTYHDGICVCKPSDEVRAVYVSKDLSMLASRSYRDLSALNAISEATRKPCFDSAALAAI